MTVDELLTEALLNVRSIQSTATKKNLDPFHREQARLASEAQDRIVRAMRLMHDDTRRLDRYDTLVEPVGSDDGTEHVANAWPHLEGPYGDVRTALDAMTA
jgi:hypothetical protein